MSLILASKLNFKTKIPLEWLRPTNWSPCNNACKISDKRTFNISNPSMQSLTTLLTLGCDKRQTGSNKLPFKAQMTKMEKTNRKWLQAELPLKRLARTQRKWHFYKMWTALAKSVLSRRLHFSVQGGFRRAASLTHSSCSPVLKQIAMLCSS